MHNPVKAEISRRMIPTYGLGKPEINPVFFEKRVYQGSSGKVYPVPFIDKVYDHKEDKEYVCATLENEYVKLELLPEIGGRIFTAQDKTNNHYDFFYRQDVIKPALVGLAGPWISGGVEFNWPQHHRPGTYLPSDVYIEHEPDGAKTVWMSEYDPLARMKGMHGIRLRPGTVLIELRARLFNRTPFIQTFLWWANVAVRVHDQYESFFPADVHYVADHAIRAMSSFPEAQNDYYGIPYHLRKGRNDLRKYNNIPVPTSYMVCETGFDFFGGYDHHAKGGFIHVANRHISPGKKQWTWGCEEFGKAWDRELTDHGGPYFELMAGVYTDNQPDFTYLAPYETKTFSQFWWPYQKLGPVQNANRDLALKLQLSPDQKIGIGVASVKKMEGLKVVLKAGAETRIFENIAVDPASPWEKEDYAIDTGSGNTISLIVLNHQGEELLDFHLSKGSGERNRPLAVEPPMPSGIQNNDELNLVGEHLDQYRHPTRYPEPYWEKAVEENPKDYRAYISLGKSMLKQGQLSKAENYFRSAISILTTYHPNPQTGEAHYHAGLSCFLQDKAEEAYGLLYKATWNYAWRSAAFYLLSVIDCRQNQFDTALEHLENSLDTNRQNNKALIMKAVILRKQDENTGAMNILDRLLLTDPLDQWALYEKSVLNENSEGYFKSGRNDAQIIIDLAYEYADAGFFDDGIELLKLHHIHETKECAVPDPMMRSPMTQFMMAWLYSRKGQNDQASQVLKEASMQEPDYLFPSRIGEQMVLEWAVRIAENPSLAAYGLGNYYYDIKRHEDAIAVWELAAEKQMQYGTLYRNLGIAYWNTRRDAKKARKSFEKAIALSHNDTRILFEYDQLRKKLNDAPSERLSFLEPVIEKILTRDDFTVELTALYNFEGHYAKALQILENKRFHPWEGGEGQVLKQYSQACIGLGKQALDQRDPKEALHYFSMAENTPDNLGEKYHPLQAKAHINYWRGMACKAMENERNAEAFFHLSAEDQGDFIEMMVSDHSEMTYYSALSMRELGKREKANELLQELKAFGLKKLKEPVKIDYFATSLPLLLVFEEDLAVKNECDSKLLIALAEKGMGNDQKAKQLASEILDMQAMHAEAKYLL